MVLPEVRQAADCELACRSVDGKLQADLKIFDGPVGANRNEEGWLVTLCLGLFLPLSRWDPVWWFG